MFCGFYLMWSNPVTTMHTVRPLLLLSSFALFFLFSFLSLFGDLSASATALLFTAGISSEQKSRRFLQRYGGREETTEWDQKVQERKQRYRPCVPCVLIRNVLTVPIQLQREYKECLVFYRNGRSDQSSASASWIHTQGEKRYQPPSTQGLTTFALL